MSNYFGLLGCIAALARSDLLLQTEYRGLSVCLSVFYDSEPYENG